ncbi:uncharacterized protein LOC120778001 [Bactrocera tryoni]|uniref:uncharacterized protein LOC120778001 n=1 Tax=Bactrocera tryoni TaxID=59916 RepID=UPI001A99F449|nr:uncharacterized protein LOC120778001 [Bactrocera tryoni]
MGGCRCSFRGCPVGTSQNPGMHFFHFPLKHRERYRRWLKLANTMHFLDFNKAYQKNRVICARHFRDECFKNYKRDGLNKGAEPTLMRLNDEMALDYSHEEENGGPELIKLPQCTLKHLIPPEGYVFAFSFHDNLVVSEYLKENNIVLGNTHEAKQLHIEKRQREEDHISFDNSTNAKKMKILNSTAINLLSKTSEIIPADTIINIKIDQNVSTLDIPLDTEVNFESEEAGEDISIEAEEEGEYDFIQIENYINENSVELESDNIFNQQKCDELSKELLDKDEKYVKKTEELLARIRELEKELGQSKDELKKKTTILSRTEIELDKASTAYQNLLENYEELENKYKNELEINKNTSIESRCLKQEKARLSEKCLEYEKQKQLKQKEAVTTSQASSSSIGKEIAIGNRRYTAGGHNNMQNTPSKAQLFNGIKKYISSSMLALLRMEMFGSADRNWKPDEQRVAMDLLQLGDEVYKYINDEWRFRLPALGEVRTWLADTTNSMDDEEDL